MWGIWEQNSLPIEAQMLLHHAPLLPPTGLHNEYLRKFNNLMEVYQLLNEVQRSIREKTRGVSD